MQCCALTEERRRCPEVVGEGAGYCVRHSGGLARKNGNAVKTRAGGIFARLRNTGGPPIPDGGKYDVPSWMKDAPTPQVIDHLQTSPESMVRWLAAFVLRKRRAVNAFEALWTTLQSDSTRFVRQQAAVALGKIGTPEVIAPLVEGLNHDPDQGVRQACAVALGNLGISSATEEIVRVLEREENIFVRWDCIVALGQLGDGRVEDLLLRLQREEIAQVVRDACRDALAEIRGRAVM